jgi:hypothetical protein
VTVVYLILVALQILDGHLTHRVIQYGTLEQNPLLVKLFQRYDYVVVLGVIKSLVCLLLFIVFELVSSFVQLYPANEFTPWIKSIFLALIWALIALYAAMVINNYKQFLKAKRRRKG